MTRLIEKPELGAIENKRAASLARLAPIARGSEQRQTPHPTGRADQRKALNIPAPIAIRFNADMKDNDQAIIAAGTPPELATTAIMRKLTISANGLPRDQQT